MPKLDAHVPDEDERRDTLRFPRGTRPQVKLGDDGAPTLAAKDLQQIIAELERPLSALALETSLVEQVEDPRAQRVLGRIAAKVAELDRVVRDLVDLASIQQDRLVIHRRAHELRGLIDDTLERTLSARDRSRVAVEAPSACLANVDATRLERVIATLVRAALRASTERVLVRLETRAGIAEISVSDARLGATVADVALAFDARHAGIALYAARKIVEAHGGTARAESPGGEGMRVRIELPMTTRGKRARTLDGLHLLLVDDDVNQLDALAALLRRERMTVVLADRGSAAVLAVRTSAIDVAVLDAALPDVGGRELVQQLLSHHPGLPIIVTSGHPYDDHRIVEMLRASGGRYLAKPLDVELLLDAIAACVDPAG